MVPGKPVSIKQKESLSHSEGFDFCQKTWDWKWISFACVIMSLALAFPVFFSHVMSIALTATF